MSPGGDLLGVVVLRTLPSLATGFVAADSLNNRPHITEATAMQVMAIKA